MKNIKEIINALINWINNIKKLSYLGIFKNMIIVFFVVIIYILLDNVEKLSISGDIIVFSSLILILCFCLVVYFLSLKNYCKKKEEKESAEKIEMLNNLSPTLDAIYMKSIYKLNANRIMLMAYHNGQKIINGTPFSRQSAIKEVVDEDANTALSADYFQSQILTLYRFPQYVNTHGKFMGTVEDVAKIDYKYKQQLQMHNINYIASKVIRIDGLTIGRITIGWEHGRTIPSPDKIDIELNELINETKSFVKIKLK